MTVQSEYQLENELIDQLKQLGYASVTLKDESQLLSNLKTQLERANALPPLSQDEWKQVISHLNSGTVFERAKNLRDRFPVKFDDGSSRHIDFLFNDASKNIYQVTHQITIDHRDHNGRTSRFDVTLLVNGLPLVQIELKKRGMEIAEAFNQTQRYTREAYWAGLIQFYSAVCDQQWCQYPLLFKRYQTYRLCLSVGRDRQQNHQ
jgi:type I restriction enzyme R subunit